MREIKFRAWDTDNDGMWYSDREEDSGEGPIIWNIDSDGIWFEENTLIDRLVGGEHEQTMEYRKPNQILMQYTGFNDELKREIFEGDILEYRTFEEGGNQSANYTEQVEFINGAFYPMSKARQNEDEFYNIEIRCIKVIGNIHENPDLLK